MKKIKTILLVLLIVSLSNVAVFADDGIELSKSELNIKPGFSGWFEIIANNVAGKLDLESTNEKIATINTSSVWVDKDRVMIYVNALSIGECYININLTDVASYNEEVVSGKRTVKVVVSEEGSSENPPVIKPSGDADVNLADLLDFLPGNTKDSLKIAFEKGSILDEQATKALISSVSSFSLNHYSIDDTLELGLSFITENLTACDINPNYTFKPIDNADIVKKYNLKSYKIVDIEDDGDFPKETSIKVYVGDVFENSTVICIYNIEHSDEMLFKKVVKDGYIEFDLTSGGLYIFSDTEVKAVNYTWVIVSGVVVVAALALLIIGKKKKH